MTGLEQRVLSQTTQRAGQFGRPDRQHERHLDDLDDAFRLQQMGLEKG